MQLERLADQDPGLLRAPAPELDEFDRAVERGQHLAGIALQNLRFDSGEIVLRELGDRFEERAPECVVEILGRKVLLHGSQAGAHVVRESLRLFDDRGAIKQEALVDRRELVALRNHSNLTHPRS